MEGRFRTGSDVGDSTTSARLRTPGSDTGGPTRVRRAVMKCSDRAQARLARNGESVRSGGRRPSDGALRDAPARRRAVGVLNDRGFDKTGHAKPPGRVARDCSLTHPGSLTCLCGVVNSWSVVVDAGVWSGRAWACVGAWEMCARAPMLTLELGPGRFGAGDMMVVGCPCRWCGRSFFWACPVAGRRIAGSWPRFMLMASEGTAAGGGGF